MALYTRFEMFIPTFYDIETIDPETGKQKRVRKAVTNEVLQFENEIKARYKGLTQSNPMTTAPLKGWWVEAGKPPVTDYLTFLCCLVKIHEYDDALDFFGAWKQRLEENVLHQSAILLMYFPVNTIGDFL